MEQRDAIYDQLLELNFVMFAAEEYEAAYHALAAAFHRATDRGIRALILQVVDIATEQMTWIDTHTPQHPLSSSAARNPSQTSIYGLLAKQARTRAQLIEHNR